MAIIDRNIESNPLLERAHGEVAWTTPQDLLVDSDLIDAKTLAPLIIELDDLKNRKPETWKYEPGDYSESRMMGMLDDIKSVFGGTIPEDHFTHSYEYVQRSFAMFEGRFDGTVPEADFAFVVPTRTSSRNFSIDPGHSMDEKLKEAEGFRGHEGAEYTKEIEQFLPVVRNLDPLTRTQLFGASPPMIFETYGGSTFGKKGVAIFAPVTLDMLAAISANPDSKRGDMQKISSAIISEAINFGRDTTGLAFAGIGAIFPGLTHHGRRLEVPGVEVTTGHAGTISLIGQVLERSIEEGVADVSTGTIGVLGPGGSIGRAAVTDVLTNTEYSVGLYDIDPAKTARLNKDLSEQFGHRIKVVESAQELVDVSKTIISAVTTPITPENFDRVESLDGVVIIDDSEPGSANDSRFKALGTRVVGVIGELPEALGARQAGYNNFGGEIMSNSQVYGCEAETIALSSLEMEEQLAVKKAVSQKDVKAISHAFDMLGIKAAPLQYQGSLL